MLPSCEGFARPWGISKQVRPPKANCHTNLPAPKSILLICQCQQSTRQLEGSMDSHDHVVPSQFCMSMCICTAPRLCCLQEWSVQYRRTCGPCFTCSGDLDQYWSISAATQAYNKVIGRKRLLGTIHCIHLAVASHKVHLLPFRAKENK